MKYGHEDKKTGISLHRDVYAEQFADAGDIKTNYMIKFHGDTLLEGEDPRELAKDLMSIINRLHVLAYFLRRKGSP